MEYQGVPPPHSKADHIPLNLLAYESLLAWGGLSQALSRVRKRHRVIDLAGGVPLEASKAGIKVLSTPQWGCKLPT